MKTCAAILRLQNANVQHIQCKFLRLFDSQLFWHNGNIGGEREPLILRLLSQKTFAE